MRPSVLVTLAAAAGLLGACGSDEEAAPPPIVTAAVVPSTEGLTAERLPDLAVGLSDLPAGFAVRREEFADVSGDVVGEFRRFFDPGEAMLGQSRVADLSSDIALFRNEEVAAAAIGTILATLVGDEVEQAFAAIVRAAAGIEATNVEGETLVSRDLGESAVVARATFDTEAGRAEAVFMVVHVGRLHHALFLIGLPGEVRIEDARAVTQAVIPRLQEADGGAFAA